MIEEAGVRFNNGDYYHLKVDTDVPECSVVGTINGVAVELTGGSGGDSYTLVYDDEVSIDSATSTQTEVLSQILELEPNNLYICEIIDKNGVQASHFYKTVTLLPVVTSSYVSAGYTQSYDVASNVTLRSNGSSPCGVYPLTDSQLKVSIYKRETSNSQTVSGTYSIKIYKIDFLE